MSRSPKWSRLDRARSAQISGSDQRRQRPCPLPQRGQAPQCVGVPAVRSLQGQNLSTSNISSLDESVTENRAGIQVLGQLKVDYPSVTKTWVDAGFKNQFVEHAATLGIDAEVVPRNAETRGFHVVKRRWVVERSLGWLMLHRRLARDYETRPDSSEAMIHIAMLDNVSRRITDESTPTWRGAY
jgi:hypothetical protein